MADIEVSPAVNGGEINTEQGSWPNMSGLRWRFSKKAQLRRLIADIQRFDLRLQSVSGAGLVDPRSRRALGEAQGLVTRAKWWVEQKDVDSGWSLLLEAYRQEGYWMTQAERKAWALTLRAEAAGKLKGWRKNAFSLLIPPEGDIQDVNPDILHQAMYVLSEDGQNLYRKLALLSQQIKNLSVLICVILLAFILLIVFGPDATAPVEDAPVLLTPDLLLKVLLLGALGGAISAVQPLKLASGRTSVPSVLRQNPMTYVRPLVGAGAALAVYWFVQAGLVQIGSGGVAGLLAVAFAAGFSEKLIMRAVESVVGGIDEGTVEDAKAPPSPNAPQLPAAAGVPVVGQGQTPLPDGETLLAGIPSAPEGEPTDAVGKELLARIPGQPE